MKCPNCGGKGKYKNGFGKIGVCYYCLGTGEINDKCERVKTEQEYLQTCTTEQLAETIHKIIDDGLCGLCKWDCRERCIVQKADENKVILEWLKQPHTEKE